MTNMFRYQVSNEEKGHALHSGSFYYFLSYWVQLFEKNEAEINLLKTFSMFFYQLEQEDFYFILVNKRSHIGSVTLCKEKITGKLSL